MAERTDDKTITLDPRERTIVHDALINLIVHDASCRGVYDADDIRDLVTRFAKLERYR